MRTQLTRVGLAVGLAVPLLLAGCGSGSGADTCAQLTDAGVTGASFGPVQPLLPKEDLLPRIDSTLVPLQTATAAPEVAQEWATLQSWLEDYRAAADAVPAGGTVGDPELFHPGEDVYAAQRAMTDWWFASCA